MLLLCAGLTAPLAAQDPPDPQQPPPEQPQDPTQDQPQNPPPEQPQDQPEEQPQDQPPPIEEPAAEEPAMTEQTETVQEPEPPGWGVHGTLTLRYQWRYASSATYVNQRDQDLYGYLSWEGGSAARDAITASFFGRGVVDLEGQQPGPYRRPLGSIEDSRGNAWDFRLYRAYLGFHHIIPDGEIRVGRQALYDTPVLLNLDGATVDAPISLFGQSVAWQTYGGIPEHYWESSARGDLALGTAGTITPWTGGSVRLDLMYVEDENLFGNPSDTLIGTRVEHVFPEGKAWLSGSASWLDGDTRDAGLDGYWTDPQSEWTVNFRLYSLLTRQSVNTYEFDPFTTVLGDEQPYYEGQVIVSKHFDSSPLGESWRADLGAYGRTLRGSAPENEFNHSFQRYWVAGTFEEFPWPAASFTVNADWWDAGDVIESLGAELDTDIDADTQLTLSSAYSLYRYDFFSQSERTRVRDYSARLRRELSDALNMLLSVSYEVDDVSRYTVATAQLEVHF